MTGKVKFISVILCAVTFIGCIAGISAYQKAAKKAGTILFQNSPAQPVQFTVSGEADSTTKAVEKEDESTSQTVSKKSKKKTAKVKQEESTTEAKLQSGNNEDESPVTQPTSASTDASTQTTTTAIQNDVTQPPDSNNYYGTQTQTNDKPADKSAISKVCMISSAYAEARPVTPLSNTYVPTYNALPYGTLDIITDTATCTEKGTTNEYYVLQSGRMVESSDCTVLDGYTLYDNSITFNSCTSDTNGLTINLRTSWRVPFTVTFTQQDYTTGYEGKAFNVSSFTASRMDISFFYTPAATGTVDVSSSDILSYASVYCDKAAKITTLSLIFKAQGVFNGYCVGYNADSTMYIGISDKTKPLYGSVVLLDPGHGGSDCGALGLNGSVYESNVNLQIASMVAQKLVQSGATVYMTRTDNSNITLTERRAQTEYLKPDIFVSIHCNSSTSPDTHGTSVFYYQPWSAALSSCIYSRLKTAFDTQILPGKSSGSGSNFYPFSVCRSTCCPSVLVETAYLSNADDCSTLISIDGEEQIAYAVYCGISDYLCSQT